MQSLSKILIGLLLAAISAGFIPSVCANPALSSRIANYELKIHFDPESKIITGEEVLHWVNSSDRTATELRFHLYWNAFKNSATLLAQEAGNHFQAQLAENNGWGEIRIDSLQLPDGRDLTGQLEFVAPAGYLHDETVVRLPQVVRPGKSIQLKIWFTAKLPRLLLRTGFSDDFFFVAQWFPKIGVFNGTWNCHPFHRNSEFFADFGVYDVQITLPSRFVVAAVGHLISRQKQAETTTWHFRAEDVHDFAWSASPDFQIATDSFHDTQILFYYLPWHRRLVPQHLVTVRKSLELTTEWFGEYPYPTLSFLSPPLNALEAAGMEYPTFFTAGAIGFLPAGIRFSELVAIHEFSHNYWYGLVASNEFEEPWLDEGFASYTEIKLIEALFGNEANVINFLGFELDDRSLHRAQYLSRPDVFPLTRRAWEVPLRDYGHTFYNKPALLLLTLENFLAPGQMQTVLREYFRRWKFRHPRTSDFVNVVNDVTGQNWDWFFNQFLYESGSIDYAVTEIFSSEMKPLRGQPPVNYAPPADSSGSDSVQYFSRVRIERLADGRLPVEIQVTFSSGQSIRERWEGLEKYNLLEYRRRDFVVVAEVDPDRKIQLDRQFSNNSRSAEFQNAGVNRLWFQFLFWIQNALLLVSVAG